MASITHLLDSLLDVASRRAVKRARASLDFFSLTLLDVGLGLVGAPSCTNGALSAFIRTTWISTGLLVALGCIPVGLIHLRAAKRQEPRAVSAQIALVSVSVVLFLLATLLVGRALLFSPGAVCASS